MPCGLCWSYCLFFKLTVKLDFKAFCERIHHFLWLSASCYLIGFSAVQVFLVLFMFSQNLYVAEVSSNSWQQEKLSRSLAYGILEGDSIWHLCFAS